MLIFFSWAESKIVESAKQGMNGAYLENTNNPLSANKWIPLKDIIVIAQYLQSLGYSRIDIEWWKTYGHTIQYIGWKK